MTPDEAQSWLNELAELRLAATQVRMLIEAFNGPRCATADGHREHNAIAMRSYDLEIALCRFGVRIEATLQVLATADPALAGNAVQYH